MAKIGIIRCEKNADRCPLTNCLKSLKGMQQGFSNYDSAELIGVFTCHCPGDTVTNLGKILKNKGAETIHLCTCTFAHKDEGKWIMGNGFCDHIDDIVQTLSNKLKIPCFKGTAHLPDEYSVPLK